LFVLFCFVFACRVKSGDTVKRSDVRWNGTCGDGVSWTIDFDGTMIIEGNGGIVNGTAWKDYRIFIDRIVIKEGVTYIGEQSFNGCVNLKNVTIPKSVLTIGSHSFFDCKTLENVFIEPGLQTIGWNAFRNCFKLSNIILPETLTSIGEAAFMSAEGLPKIIIPKSVTSIADHAFAVCYSLENVTVLSRTTFVGCAAFNSCKKLSNVVFYGDVTYIEDSAFSDCPYLVNMTFLGSVSSFGSNLFALSDNLTTIFYLSSLNVSNSSSQQYELESLKNVCVPPDYPSDILLGYNVTFESETCKEFQSLYDHCYQAQYDEGSFVRTKRNNATEWESKVNDCMNYICDNDQGRQSWSKCNSSADGSFVCVSGQCIENETIKGWIVEIDITQTTAGELNTSEILSSLCSMTNLETSELVIGYEVDEEGFIIHIIVYVKDEETGILVMEAIDDLEKGETCQQGVLCKSKNSRVIEVKTNSLSSSKSNTDDLSKANQLLIPKNGMTELMLFFVIAALVLYY